MVARDFWVVARALLGSLLGCSRAIRERVATTPFTPMERCFFYIMDGSWSLSKVPGSSSKHMQRHRDAAEQTVCDALLKG